MTELYRSEAVYERALEDFHKVVGESSPPVGMRRRVKR